MSHKGAFGVDSGYAPYQLRQARYHALAEDIAAFVEKRHRETGQRTTLLDVGVGKGVSRRYLEVHPADKQIDYHAVDRYQHGPDRVYKYDAWQHHKLNLEDGLEELASESFDVVICEQVLEHLHQVEFALQELTRVLKPGGFFALGVPTFPPGIHWIRRDIVPKIDRLVGRKPRCHVQAFSKNSFLALVRKTCDVEIHQTRGFRIVSGGVLRPLEHCRWWWLLNRRIGAMVPSLCVEIQVIATKNRPCGAAQPEQLGEGEIRRAA